MNIYGFLCLLGVPTYLLGYCISYSLQPWVLEEIFVGEIKVKLCEILLRLCEILRRLSEILVVRWHFRPIWFEEESRFH